MSSDDSTGREPLGDLVGRGLTGANPRYVDPDEQTQPDSDEDPDDQLPNLAAMDDPATHRDPEGE